MSDDLKYLKKLEANLQYSLQKVDLDEVWDKGKSYTLDGKRVIALNLDGLKTVNCPEEVGQFQYLEILSLGYMGIQDISPMTDLKKLKQVYLANNQIQDISPIAAHNALTQLDLQYNQIQDISPIAPLSALSYLNLHNNRIQDISPIAALNPLIHVDLRDNRISHLPKDLALSTIRIDLEKRPGFRRLCLAGNPLTSPPPEIIRQGKDALAAFYAAAQETRVLNEAKVILVGDGGAGKTSLVKRLRHQPMDPHEPQTHGINIQPWSFQRDDQTVAVRFWDFGGQEIMHATHQFFLSQRCLYLLVLDGRRDEKTEYWLKHIESFGGNSPVLVVLNKIDQNAGHDLNLNRLSKRYPGISGFHRVSCATDQGLSDLRQALETDLFQLELRATVWPERWFQIKKNLLELGSDYLDRTTYETLCKQAEVTDKKERETLIGYLHDLGVAIHFPEFRLKQFYVLDPQWLTNGVYRIITAQSLAEAGGVLDLDCVSQLLPEERYPEHTHSFMVDLMGKFELCYHLDGDRILVPDLLPAEDPDLPEETEETVRFRISYRYLPRTVAPRFMVRRHEEIDRAKQWRTGAVLQSADGPARARMEVDYEDQQVLLEVAGPMRHAYLTRIRDTLHGINKTFNKNKITEETACICETCHANTLPFYHKYEKLVNCYLNDIAHVVCDSSYKQVTVADLLFGKGGEPTLREALEAFKALGGDGAKGGSKGGSQLDRLLSRSDKFAGLADSTVSFLKNLSDMYQGG